MEKGLGQDGFAAINLLYGRFNAKTPATLIQNSMDAVDPPNIKNPAAIPKGIEEWESKVIILRNTHEENLGENVKIAVLIGMLPKEYQDICFHMGSTPGSKIGYEDIRTRVVNLANQRIQLATPTPMDLGSMEFPNGHRSGEWNNGWGTENSEEPQFYDALDGSLSVYAVGKRV